MSKISLCAILTCVVLTGSALATPTVTVTRTSGHYAGDGGEFTVTPNAELGALLGTSNPFYSFCMEGNEYVTMGSSYDVVLNTSAVKGGVGGQVLPDIDPLDPRTAYLYSMFVAGTLAGYDYTTGTGRSESAQALQNVIWFLEDEITTLPGGTLENTFYTAAQNSGWTDVGNVRVLNLYAVGYAGDPAFAHQDLLACVPSVPAPGAMLLVSLGTGLVGWLRRRQSL